MDNAGLSKDIKCYFFYLLEKREANLEYILSELYEIPTLKGKNTMQFSFATKLLHTIDNDKPIFDSRVKSTLQIKSKGSGKHSDKDTKIRSCIEIYDSLEQWYVKLKENEKVKNFISKFKLKFRIDKEKISDTKILDFIIWSLGKLKEMHKIKEMETRIKVKSNIN